MEGGEKVQDINLKALMKNTNYAEQKLKNTVKKDEDPEFSEVMTKKMSERETKPKIELEKKVSDENIQKEEPKNEEPKLIGNKNEKITQLIELLMPFKAGVGTPLISIDSIDQQHIDNLKQIVSELLLEGLSNENKGNKEFLVLKDFGLKAINITGLPNTAVNNDNTLKQDINNLASQIVGKLMTDSDFREQLMIKFNEAIQGSSNTSSEALKQALINKVSSMTNKDIDSKVIVDKNTIQPEVHKTLFKSDTETTKILSEDNKTQKVQFEGKVVNKEDKLLNYLVTEDSSKGAKENLSDRIANVVTRFEVIRSDKPLVVDAPVTINKDNFNADFIKAIKFMDINNIKELSVKVIPKDLGEIVIRLSLDNGVMKANITAANKETYNILNAQLPAISNQLTDQNMNIQSFNLSLSNGDNFLFSGNGNDQSEKKQQGKKATQTDGINSNEALVQGYDTEDSSINALA
jgi:flagellar hook-length control protein FliK